MSADAVIGWVLTVTYALRMTQRKTTADLMEAATRVGRGILSAVGRCLRGTAAKHAIKRVWRFCDNPRVHPTDAMTGVVRKWNKIEHRLSSHISINLRVRPLTSLELIGRLIGATTTTTGLVVKVDLDRGKYPTGLIVSDAELAAVRRIPDTFPGEWNYRIAQTVEFSIVGLLPVEADSSPSVNTANRPGEEWRTDPSGYELATGSFQTNDLFNE